MKNLLLAVTVMLCSSSLAAEDLTDTCLEATNVARAIMDIRQEDRPIEELFAVDIVSSDELFSNMVILAYQEPLEESFEAKQEAIDSFAGKVQDECANQASKLSHETEY